MLSYFNFWNKKLTFKDLILIVATYDVCSEIIAKWIIMCLFDKIFTEQIWSIVMETFKYKRYNMH